MPAGSIAAALLRYLSHALPQLQAAQCNRHFLSTRFKGAQKHMKHGAGPHLAACMPEHARV